MFIKDGEHLIEISEAAFGDVQNYRRNMSSRSDEGVKSFVVDTQLSKSQSK